MNIQELESICAVDQYGNYSEAAFYAASSLSVLSKHVSKVEAELSVKLFERATKTRKIERTEAGRAILPLLHEMLSAYHKSCDIARTINKRGSRIKIGYSPRVGDFLESDILSRFMTLNSDIQIFRVVESRDNLVRMIENDVLDAIMLPLMARKGQEPSLLASIGKIPNVRWRHIITNNELHLGFPVTHPLADRKIITSDLFPLLRNEVFLFSSREADPVSSRQWEYLRDLFGIEPEKFKTRQVDFAEPKLAINMVCMNGGLLPQLSFVPSRMGDVVFIPVEGWEYKVSSYLIYKEKHPNTALTKFCEVVDEFCMDSGFQNK
ncbi:MAG: LysR family transcriptional regulator [Firmicutes bacterium]|nr:LysR family transcriptional regulator [Bacillota bacterium]